VKEPTVSLVRARAEAIRGQAPAPAADFDIFRFLDSIFDFISSHKDSTVNPTILKPELNVIL